MTVPTMDSPKGGQARQPFYFNTSAHLLRAERETATTLSDLHRSLERCSDKSVFQHTFRTLQEHHFLRQGFSNDFAHWVLSGCNQPELAEQLAGVDVRGFTSITDLREALLRIVGDYLRRNPQAASSPSREPFYFCATDIVVIPTPFVANNLPEFLDGLRHVTVRSIHHHFIEGRLRLKLQSNDFSRWLEEEVDLKDPARAINNIDIYTGTMEDVRRQMVRLLEAELA
jgi:hypothetical protein